MLPKKYRTTFTEFQKNPRKFIRFSTFNFEILVKKSDKNTCRFVFIIPKYIDKRSCVRHKIKRLLVEIIRTKIAEINTQSDFFIKAKKGILNHKREEIESEIMIMLNKVGNKK
jgi:ribonuclease P protein component